MCCLCLALCEETPADFLNKWFGSMWEHYKAPFGWKMEMERAEFLNGKYEVVKSFKDPFSD